MVSRFCRCWPGLLILVVLAHMGVAENRSPLRLKGARDADTASDSKVPRAPVRIRKLQGVGNGALVRSPEYSVKNMPRTVGAEKQWARIDVEYETYPEWIDELVIQYHMLTEKAGREGKTYSLFKTAVRYADVERGRKHLGTAFLRPAGVKRFGLPIAVGVELVLKGEVVGHATESEQRMPDKWWEDPRVVEREGVTARAGYLLSRAQTPFTFVNVDDYEETK